MLIIYHILSVLLESVLRQYDGHIIKEEHIMNLAK